MAFVIDSPAVFSTFSPALQLICTIAALLSLKLLASTLYNIFFHPLRHVPGPRLAAFSSLWVSRQRSKFQLSHTIRDAHQKYGPIVRIGPNGLHFASPSALRQIYIHGRDGPRKGTFYSSADLLHHYNLFSVVDKQRYAGRKKLVSKCFSQRHLSDFLVGVRNLTNQLGEQLARRSMESEGNVVDLYDWMVGFTFEAMYVMCFNEDAGMMRTGTPHPVLNYMELSNKCLPMSAAFPILRQYGHLVPIAAISDPYKATLKWKEFTMSKVDEARFLPNKTPFLARLVDTEDESLGRPLNYSEATEEVMGLLFAGSGTTATTMIYLLYELAQIPDFQTRLYEELCTVPSSKDGVPNYQDIRGLPLLQALINETLRRHPAIVGTLPRIAEIDMVVEGVAVPRGTEMSMSNLTHHFDPSIYPEPYSFHPDRWIVPEAQADKLKGAYSPFGVGPRNCIGQSYSICEMQILIAMLVYRFTFALTDRMKVADMTPFDLFTGIPKAGMLELIIKERESRTK